MEIKHDKNNQRFFSIVDGRESYLQYLKIDNSTLDYYKTYVPNELRGKGIAGKIVESALNYALQNNLIIIPSCSYVDTFIERHPDYNKIVKK
ncbi:MAG TPA: GNAT family N-acetyltransferase [Ignavibacteriaceae bacterium]|nr:GNAT family N-acetyltransferase [Ignavibacteriaceae bacterium]